MEAKIGPYRITQRTPYSKIRVLNIDTNEDLSDDITGEVKEIIDAYISQKENIENYLLIEDDCVCDFAEDTPFDLKYLFIPEGITEIDEYAFEDKEFKYISLPSTLKKISKCAFYNCTQLERIDIPNSVEEIGSSAFEGCVLLQNVTLPPIDGIDTRLFFNCTSLNNIIIPDTVKYIEASVFYDCISLKSVILSKNLQIISDFAFNGCVDLQKINLPNSLSRLGEGVFADCDSLTEVIVPNSVDSIGPRLFYNCANLKTVKLSENITRLREGLFCDCVKLQNIKIPDNVSYIGSNIFEGTSKIKEINIPKNLTMTSNRPFGNSGIETLVFNHDLKEITNVDFSESNLLNSSKICKLVIGDDVNIITDRAFEENCKITDLKYYGTQKEFKEFKKNNKKLFKNCLENIKTIDIVNSALGDDHIDFSR